MTALGTLLAAVAGLLTALTQIGVVQVRSPIVLNPTTTVSTAGTTGTTGPSNLDTPTTIAPGLAAAPFGGFVTVYLDQLEALSDSPETGSREIGGVTYPHALSVDGCAFGTTARRFDYNLGRHYRRFVTTVRCGQPGAGCEFEDPVRGVR